MCDDDNRNAGHSRKNTCGEFTRLTTPCGCGGGGAASRIVLHISQQLMAPWFRSDTRRKEDSGCGEAEDRKATEGGQKQTKHCHFIAFSHQNVSSNSHVHTGHDHGFSSMRKKGHQPLGSGENGKARLGACDEDFCESGPY